MKTTLFFLLSAITFFHLSAQDTLDISNPKLQINQLKEGTDNYLVYMYNSDVDTLMSTSVWKRSVKSSKLNGIKTFTITQSWGNGIPKYSREVYSIVNAQDFSPIYHKTISRGKVEAYNFTGQKIIGADSVTGNSKKDFELVTDILPYNWELDLEMFQMLPYKKSKDLYILYYHPGGRIEPGYYKYANQGVVSLEQPKGETPIDCYKIFIEYGNKGHATFYVSTATKKVLRMEEQFGHITRYKIRL